MLKPEFKYLPLDVLSPNPLRPRASVSRQSLFELADSIRKYGILTPILAGETPAGLQVIAGERRLKAAKIAGFKEIPCIVLKIEAKEMAILALVENLQRQDLNILEQAGLIERMSKELNLSLQEIGEAVGLAVSEIEDWQKTLELPDKVKSAYLAGKISDKQFLFLAKLENPLEILSELDRLSRS